MPRVRGGERERQAATAQERLRGTTTRPRSGVEAEGAIPHPKLGVGAEKSNPRPRNGGCTGTGGWEELLHIQGQEGRLVQGKEQQLRFAGPAMKR